MKATAKRFCTGILAAIVACALLIPIASFASNVQSNADTTAADSSAEAASGDSLMTSYNAVVTNVEGEEVEASKPEAQELTPGTNCRLTLRYYENVTYEDPGVKPNEENRYFLGERVIDGLTVGQKVDTWDYVVSIPNFFFFDAWPARLTISKDPDQNVIELYYGRYWDQSLTVNYYLMEGADLTADNWTDALAPKDVTFTKLATETFENEPYGKLVEGDAYEYKLDDMYVVDTYPPEIRLGVDNSDNTINVLYVPNSTHLPSDFEINEVPEEIAADSNKPSTGTSSGSNSGSNSGSSSGTLPGDVSFDKDTITSILPDNSAGSSTLPNGMTTSQVDELFNDFISMNTGQITSGGLQITDEMLAHPQNPKEAYDIANAYLSGLNLNHDGDSSLNWFQVIPVWFWIILLILLVLAIIGYSLYFNERSKYKELASQASETTTK